MLLTRESSYQILFLIILAALILWATFPEISFWLWDEKLSWTEKLFWVLLTIIVITVWLFFWRRW